MHRYWKHTLTVVVLTEDENPQAYYSLDDLERIAYEVTDGGASGQVILATREEVSAERMGQLLIKQGSSPDCLVWDEESQE